MKILIGYAIILGFLISFCDCYNFSVTVDPYHKEIYKFVKEVITDWNQKHENDINGISIINLDNDTSLFHIVRKAIPKENPIMLPECKKLDNIEYVNARKSNIFIIISKIVEDAQTYANQFLGCIESGLLATHSNVLVISSANSTQTEEIVHPGTAFSYLRTLNCIISYAHEGKIFALYKLDALHNKLAILNVTTDTNVLFDDTLIDMKGYTYKTIVDKNDQRLVKNDDKLLLPETLLMETVAKKQNAQIQNDFTDLKDKTNFETEITEGEADMVLNLGYYSGLLGNYTAFGIVNTYEVNGYCALIPTSLAHVPFMSYVSKPFSNYVWFFLILSIATGSLIWEGFRRLSEHRMVSGKHFIVDVLLAFFQQSISTRKGRFVLRIMLQYFIFMMIVLANLYQGMMTSILMDPRKSDRIGNIQELISRNYDFYSDSLFFQIAKEYDTNHDLVSKTKPLEIWLHSSEYIKQFQELMTAKPNSILIVGCDAVPELLETQINDRTKASDVYYEFHQKLLTYYENILLARRSPFYEKLNDMSLRIHESGIKQHWAMLMDWYKNSYYRDGNEAYMLGIKEMLPIIHVYIYGNLAACFVFLLELSKNYIRLIYRRTIKKCMRSLQRYRNRKVGPRLQRIEKGEPSRVEEDMPLYPYLP